MKLNVKLLMLLMVLLSFGSLYLANNVVKAHDFFPSNILKTVNRAMLFYEVSDL